MPITIDVITKVVDSSLRGSSDTIDRHFTKSGKDAGEKFAKALTEGVSKSPELQRAFDRAADATGRLRIEQEKLNAVNEKAASTDAQKIAAAEKVEKAKRDEARAVKAASEAYEQANTSAGRLVSTISNLASGTRFGGVLAQTESLATSFGGIGLATGGAIAGVTALGVAAVAVGKNMYDLGRQWDDVSDSIVARTGKVGAELESIVDQIGAVSVRTAATTGELGNIAGQILQSIRPAGNEIAGLTQTIAELNNLTGDQTNVRALGMVFRMFDVDASEYNRTLNNLYGTFQQTGIPVNELIATLVKAGPILSEFGMSFEQAAGFVKVFEEAGISADASIKGLRAALKNLTEAGRDPREGLQGIITEIQNLIAANDMIGARNLAESAFGKGFAEILTAIKDNRLALESLPEAIDPFEDRIRKNTEATEDLAQEWTKFKNFFGEALRPAATSFFSFMNDQMSNMTNYMVEKVGEISVAFSELFSKKDWFGPDSGFGRIMAFLGLGQFGGGGSFGGGNFGNTTPNSRLDDSQGYGIKSQPSVVAGANAVLEVFGDQIRGNIHGTRDPNKTGVKTAPGTHQVGLAMDIPIGPDQLALGDQINAYLQANARELNIKYTIWRDTLKNIADGSTANVPGHFDHIDVQFNDGTTMSASTGGGLGRSAGVPLNLGGTKPTPVGPGTATPQSPTQGSLGPSAGTFTPGTFPAAGDIAPASPNQTPVQMIPSPFGAGYQPVPAGSTPGFNQYGKPGYYLPDPAQIERATKQYESSVESANEAAQAIEEAKQRQAEAAQKAAELEQSWLSSSDERAAAQERLNAANKAVTRAVKAAENAAENADQAEQQLAEAKRGTFREAQKAAEARESAKAEARKRNGFDEFGFPLADDFGLSEGLPGIAKWLTTFAANVGMAPMQGALANVAGGGSAQTGFGALGMMGANNLASGGSPLGLSMIPSLTGSVPSLPGPRFTQGSSPVPAAMGPAPLGGGLGSLLPLGATPSLGPGTAQTSMAPSAGPGGGGFAGLGGLPMAAISSAISSGAMAGDMMGGGGGGQVAAAAAQMAIQLANRTAGYIGQSAAIGVGGLMETFLPHNSAVADPGKSWIGRIAAGFAGARPALPNAAGEAPADKQNPAGNPQPPQTPEEAAKLAQQQGGGQSGPMVNVENLNNYSPDGGQSVANQIGRMQMSSYASGGPR